MRRVGTQAEGGSSVGGESVRLFKALKAPKLLRLGRIVKVISRFEVSPQVAFVWSHLPMRQ